MACPGSCTSCCSTYSVQPFYNSHFQSYSFTLTPSGTCIWEDSSSYCAISATITCDATDGWTLILNDSNTDCQEVYSTGTFTACPPEEPYIGPEIGGAIWIPISATGSGCYSGSNNPAGGYVTVTTVGCASGGSSSSGVGLGNFFLVFPS